MEWTVSGTLGGRRVSATWTDGALAGDPELVARFHALEGATVGWLGGGPYYTAALEPWPAALWALLELVADPELEGVPDDPAAELPDGVVG